MSTKFSINFQEKAAARRLLNHLFLMKMVTSVKRKRLDYSKNIFIYFLQINSGFFNVSTYVQMAFYRH